MTTAWTLTRERIADKALEKCRRLAAGQTPPAEDRNLALEALDAILKELPTYGYVWPKITPSQTALTLAAATSPTALPADYFSGQEPQIVYVDASGNEIPLTLLQLPDWNAIPVKTEAADYPISGYISPDSKLWTWPVQSGNVSAKMFYQKVIDDTVGGTAPNIDQPLIRGIVYGIAADIGFEFGVNKQDRDDFRGIYMAALARNLQAQRGRQGLTVEVDD